MVRCSDNTFYTGITNNIPKRIEKHDDGKGAKYTRGRGPVTLVWARKFQSKSEALTEEARVKKLSRFTKESMAPWWCHTPSLRKKNILFQAFIEVNAKYEQKTKGKLIGSPSIRKELFNTYSRAVPTEEALRAIVRLSPLVEMGAGTGYWASLLNHLGADIIAYDRIDSVNLWHTGPTRFFDVKNGSPESLLNHSDRSLFLCWPPADSKMAVECLRNWKGRELAYVGDFNGLTGDQEFYDVLRRDFVLTQTIEIPQWAGAEDYLTIWQK